MSTIVSRASFITSSFSSIAFLSALPIVMITCFISPPWVVIHSQPFLIIPLRASWIPFSLLFIPLQKPSTISPATVNKVSKPSPLTKLPKPLMALDKPLSIALPQPLDMSVKSL